MTPTALRLRLCSGGSGDGGSVRSGDVVEVDGGGDGVGQCGGGNCQ